MGAIPTQRDIMSCASDTPARVGAESLYAAPAYAGFDRRAVAHLSLPSGPLAPGAARRFVGAALAEWAELDLPGAAALSARLVEDVLVVVSELVTNAVVHAGTDVELLCRLGRGVPAAAGWLLVEVSDHHPSKTVRDEGAERPYLVERPYGAAEYGRGLRLVAALSEAWGITYRTGVKTVWARLSVDGAMAVEGAFEAYGGDEGGAGGEGGSGVAGSEGTEEVQEGHGVQGGECWDARAYAGADEAPELEGARAYADYSGYAGEAGPGFGAGPVDLVAPVPRRGMEHDREWLNRGALSFLAEASDLLAGQLDEDLVAALAGQLLVPRLADWCAVWLEEEGLGWRGGDGSLGPAPRLARVWHGSENRIEELRRALEKDPPRLPESVRSRAVPVPWPQTWSGTEGTGEGTESVSGTGTASGSGAPRVRGGPVEEGEGGPAEAGGSEAGEGGAALAYRLIAGGRPLGTLVIGRAGLLRFPDEVTGLVEDLSRRIALSIGAARQYARQATISRVLQRGLLPGAVAEIPGVSSALVYEPCDKGGPSGDFYDLFPAGRGRWGFAIGDVQGKGPEAAVVIGLARPWLRLLAREGYGVADVLDRLNQLLLDDATEAADAAARALVTAGDPGLVDPEGPQTRFLSLLYGELVPVEGGVRCTLASAGHPLPLLLGPDGDVRAVAEPQTLLGVIEDTEYVSETFELRCGDTLLCVTDGVTERRNGPHMFDDGDGLAAVLSDCAGLDAQLIAERIRRLVHEFGERPPDDDLALLVLQAE
ncbi:SpoIIE family protein phosphatase [Streptomyces europaeiscabiei]|uniref:ATP-binding SpoIIE family protein phosphatase n=1 Tax=Streptomyces europaeiscabiei TaxID=146819 RepID=UPI0029B51170|nr:ATP-binding SpoIIE family protein phosphatase [Streptomyces europaeiscabiei]MDX3689648.1 SpoIIE family protein phosphatase [Streptomyces europaeiscabiei]